MNPSAQTVGIVGGGAIGLTAAVELARCEASVHLFERDELGSGATGRAAGICYDAYAEKRDASIASDSLDYFRELELLVECPYLWFARNDDEVAAAIRSQSKRMQELGRSVSVLTPGEVTSRFPAVEADDIEVAAVAENAGYMETTRYLDAVADRAECEGVEITTGTPATVRSDGSIETDSTTQSFDAVLVAAGAHSEAVLSETEIDLALGHYRTQALTAGSLDEPVPIYYDASEEWYARPTGDGILAGDGSHLYDGDPGEYDRNADDAFVDGRLADLDHRIAADLSLDRSWAGLCTATPDRNPLLGQCHPDIFVATGLCGHGFMRSPALGRAIAGQILGDDGIPAFDPCRFDGDEQISLPVGITE